MYTQIFCKDLNTGYQQHRKFSWQQVFFTNAGGTVLDSNQSYGNGTIVKYDIVRNDEEAVYKK